MTITIERPDWTRLDDWDALVTEVPVWSGKDRALWVVDIYAPLLRRLDSETGTTSDFAMPERIGSFALKPGGAIVALATGIFELDALSGRVWKRFDAPFDASLHFNDGRADPCGRFVVGCSQDAAVAPLGRGGFFRVDATGIAPIVTGVTTANGIAFSPNGATMYTAETRRSVIYAYDYDLATGSPSGRRVFAQLEQGAFPDGATVDVDGGYWTALIGSGRIARFTPDGRLDRLVATPTLFPTMVAFGGEGGRTMFLTSSRKYLDRLDSAEQEQERHVAGGVFAWRCDAQGFAEPQVLF